MDTPLPVNCTLERIILLLRKQHPDQNLQYELWKSRFSQNIKEYYAEKEAEVNAYYTPKVKQLRRTYTYAKKTSEISRLLRNIIESGLTVTTRTQNVPGGLFAQGFTFVVKELLQPDNSQSENLFTQFLCEIEHFKALGADCYTDMQMTGRALTITYFIPVNSFSVITLQVKKLLDFLEHEENQIDFIKESFESSFEYDLERYYNNIEEEIKFYKNRARKPKLF